MSYGILIDTTRCIGCRGCQVACKQNNQLPGESTDFRAIRTNPPDLTSKTWSLVEFHEVTKSQPRLAWRFVKRQCMHCLEPACVSVCPVGALQRTAEGPVVYDAKRCIGCRYCMVACPFNVPKYNWDSTAPLIHKCVMCAERLADGDQPACTKTCPTGAAIFGRREELLDEAHRRIADRPSFYVDHVYGEQEVGGTGVLYLADVPFAAIGFPAALPIDPLPAKTWAVMSLVPGVAGGAAALMSFGYLLTRRQRGMHPGGATPASGILAGIEMDAKKPPEGGGPFASPAADTAEEEQR